MYWQHQAAREFPFGRCLSAAHAHSELSVEIPALGKAAKTAAKFSRAIVTRFRPPVSSVVENFHGAILAT